MNPFLTSLARRILRIASLNFTRPAGPSAPKTPPVRSAPADLRALSLKAARDRMAQADNLVRKIGEGIDKVATVDVALSASPAGAAWHDAHACAVRIAAACRAEMDALLDGDPARAYQIAKEREQAERDVHAAFDRLDAALAAMD